ncbi:MAG: hypothetical protein ACUVUS_08805 [Thermoproteota archaeon]
MSYNETTIKIALSILFIEILSISAGGSLYVYFGITEKIFIG